MQILLSRTLQLAGLGDITQQQDLAGLITQRPGGNTELPAVRGAQLALVQLGQKRPADDITPVFVRLQITQQFMCSGIEINHLAAGIEDNDRARDRIHQFAQMLVHRRRILGILGMMVFLGKLTDGFI